MHEMTIASDERRIKEDGFPSLAAKVQITIELLNGHDQLVYLFKKLFSRQDMLYSSRKQSAYLHTLLDELLETLSASSQQDLDFAIFQVLLRCNFNHEIVRKYYLSSIDEYIIKKPGKSDLFLEKALRYCQALDRKDLAYNKHGHTLREEIGHHINLRIEQVSPFRPFKVLLPANSFYPLIRLLMEAEVFEDMPPAVAWDSLRHVFLNDKGRRVSLNTIKHRYRIDGESNLEELKELLEKLSKSLDFEIKKKSSPTSSKN